MRKLLIASIAAAALAAAAGGTPGRVRVRWRRRRLADRQRDPAREGRRAQLREVAMKECKAA